MARKTGMMGSTYITETRPKKTRQGRGKHSKYAATSRNSARKDTEGRVVNGYVNYESSFL